TTHSTSRSTWRVGTADLRDATTCCGSGPSATRSCSSRWAWHSRTRSGGSRAAALADGEVALHRRNIKLTGVAVGAGTRLVKVDDARQVRAPAVVDDTKHAFLSDHRFLVAVRYESTQRRGVA